MIVTLAHLSSVPGFSVRGGFCRRDARKWFARYGLDWDQFRHHGLDAELFTATGDAMAAALVAHAHHKDSTDGRQ